MTDPPHTDDASNKANDGASSEPLGDGTNTNRDTPTEEHRELPPRNEPTSGHNGTHSGDTVVPDSDVST